MRLVNMADKGPGDDQAALAVIGLDVDSGEVVVVAVPAGHRGGVPLRRCCPDRSFVRRC